MIPGWQLVRLLRVPEQDARRAARLAAARRIVQGAIALLTGALAAWWLLRA